MAWSTKQPNSNAHYKRGEERKRVSGATRILEKSRENMNLNETIKV